MALGPESGNVARPGREAVAAPLFEARGISKSFGDVRANSDISMTVGEGEKHALLGENGAGKSTLVKMVDGVLQPDSGRFYWKGRPVDITSPAVARRLGIALVFQHFASFDALSVAENIAIAMPGLSFQQIRRRIREISEQYGLAIEPSRRIETLSAGERQRVEIVRALLQRPKLLILDEPTSVLTPQEADGLFKTLDTLSSEGMSIIYISHRLAEIRGFCDNATVLRHGEVVATCDPRETSVQEMAEMMIGKTAEPIHRLNSYVGTARLVVDDLSIPAREGVPLKNISFSARRGEILGIAGIAGEGQDTLFAALSGERRTPYARKITLNGKPIGMLGPTARRRQGIACAPEQRIGHAALPDLPLSENLRLTWHGLPDKARGGYRNASRKIREAFDVRSGAGDVKAGTLSGGNLQKFVIGRELERDPEVLVVAQPTWGVDAGAASSIRNALLELAAKGAAVVAISQDLDEIFQIADRVAVLHRGSLSKPYPIETMTPDKIGLLMAGESVSEESAALKPKEKPPLKVAATQSTASTAKPSPPNRTSAPPTPPPSSQAPARTPPRPPATPARLSTSGVVRTSWTPPEVFQSFEQRR